MKNFDSQLNAFFDKFSNAIKHKVPNMIAATAEEHFKNAIISKSWNNVPYQPYGNLSREPKRGSLMMRTNQLRMSIKPSLIAANRIVISAGGPRVKYARIHNEGGRISGVRKVGQYTNRNFMGKVKAVRIQSHTRTVSYTMPQRQFMGKSPMLLEQIRNRFKSEFKGYLR